ncbi:MAG: glycosyltransferase family 9 protein [Micavibrio sp.]|nr:MAG: glycosyltransferase family 9 protein [Micavibrio sp.]
MTMTYSREKILFIKLGAFGDFIMTLGYMHAVRVHHPDAELVIMTTPPFAEMAEKCGYFDRVVTVERYGFTEAGKWLRLVKMLRREAFDLVYDMQQNDRTKIMRLLSPHRTRRSWYRGGRVPEGALEINNIRDFPPPDMGWMDGDISGFALPENFVLLAPGAAPHRPLKRWPPAHYGTLAQNIAAQGFTPVILGGGAETEIAAEITKLCPAAKNLCGKTSFADIAALARHAALAVGNDTGPMHLIAAAGCPVISLFSGDSKPAQSAPHGADVTVLRAIPIENLAPEEVLAAFTKKTAARNSSNR